MKNCGHMKLKESRHFDDGVGMERTVPTAWDTKECADCGKLVAMRGSSAIVWKILPSGCRNSPYGVEFPNGYVYTS